MALYEYFCQGCGHKFEQIVSASEPGARCPKCEGSACDRLISCFAIGGRGDLRESTTHGCGGSCSLHSHSGSAAGSNFSSPAKEE